MKNFLSSRLFLLILVIIFVFISVALARAYYKDYEIRQEIKELEKRQEELQKTKINSLDLYKYVSGDAYVEDQARLELNMVGEGEKVVFLDNVLKERELPEYDYLYKEEVKVANYKKWWYYIIKHKLE